MSADYIDEIDDFINSDKSNQIDDEIISDLDPSSIEDIDDDFIDPIKSS